MATKIIVSYDGTDNDRDALALGRLLTRAGATLELAYVRHIREEKQSAERLAESDAEALLATGAAELGTPDLPQHVVLSGSTPAGLRDLAVEVAADILVFGSAYRTARGHVDPQPSARQLLDGGPVALAFAPAGFAQVGEYAVNSIAAVAEEGDPCPEETAQALASRLGATVATRGSGSSDLIVVGSKAGTATGRVRISAAAEYMIELARSPVIVLPFGVALTFS